MKFKTKLYASIGSIIVLISIIVIILMNMLEQSTVNMHVVVNELYERTKMTSTIKYETANIGRALREITANPTGNEVDISVMNEWEEAHVNLRLALETLEKMDTQVKSQELIAKFRTLHGAYQANATQIITLQKIDKNAVVEPFLSNDAKITRQRMLQMAEVLHGLQEQELKNELFRTRESYSLAVKMIYIYLALSLSLGVGFTLLIIRNITKDLNNVTSVLKSVSNTNTEALPRIDISSKGEVGAIAVAFNKMASTLEDKSSLEKQLKEEAEELSWLKTNIAEIATMYPEVENVQMLANSLITKLVPMIGANYGVFYIKETEGNDHYLKRIATYAFSNDHTQFERFRIGEGLIGQCAAEKRVILLNQSSETGIRIQTGLGQASPKAIIMVPVEFEGNVLAVIEIASLGDINTLQIKLLEEIVGNVGMTINSISNRMAVERLLQESQALTEELQAQSEELQAQSEELQVQQEELRTANEKLEEQYENSENKKHELEKVREALEEKAQQLEVSSQYKSEFLANMSHELRTPLNSLLILAQILTENEEKNLSSKQQEYVRTIYSSGTDLLQLINDILDLSKVEAGKIELIYSEIEFEELEGFVNKQFSPIASQKKVDFNIERAPNLPNVLFSDEQRLHQVLKNMLSNAFKFTETGSVSLVVRKATKKDLGEHRFNNTTVQSMLVFSVIDTGIGIAREKQNIIFEAFQQADGTTSRQFGGTGLGLSISKNIAFLLGGFIEVDSEEGKGSTFTFYLPLYESMDEIAQEIPNEEVAASVDQHTPPVMLLENQEKAPSRSKSNDNGQSLLKGKKVLIVDDDIRNVYALTTALEKYQMDIIYAENGREGIEMLRENPDVDLILMDIMMPEIDGFEAMRRIRSIPKFKTLPIIALTAKAMKHSRQECLDAGASDYISKPIILDQLFSLMQVWLYSKVE